MADNNQPDQPQRPPVRMGLRVVARHAAGRHGGRELAHNVVEQHRPKLLDASTRLARTSAAAPPPPPPPPPVPAREPPPAPAPPGAAPEAPAPAAPEAAAPAAGFDRPAWAPPEMSDWAAQWMFGNEGDQGLVPMAQAE